MRGFFSFAAVLATIASLRDDFNKRCLTKKGSPAPPGRVSRRTAMKISNAPSARKHYQHRRR